MFMNTGVFSSIVPRSLSHTHTLIHPGLTYTGTRRTGVSTQKGPLQSGIEPVSFCCCPSLVPNQVLISALSPIRSSSQPCPQSDPRPGPVPNQVLILALSPIRSSAQPCPQSGPDPSRVPNQVLIPALSPIRSSFRPCPQSGPCPKV